LASGPWRLLGDIALASDVFPTAAPASWTVSGIARLVQITYARMVPREITVLRPLVKGDRLALQVGPVPYGQRTGGKQCHGYGECARAE
jgi:hypothetical protein